MVRINDAETLETDERLVSLISNHAKVATMGDFVVTTNVVNVEVLERKDIKTPVF